MRIGARYNGPPGSGNGGYSAGLIAAGEPFEVTLRQPPPLETDLDLVRDGDILRALHDGRLVAEARPAPQPRPDAVPPVTLAEATAAAERYAGYAEHPFPTCYVCGTERTDGLGLRPGPVGDGRTATPWLVGDDLRDATMWAALDCPGGWAVIGAGRPYVLGRIAVWVDALPRPGDTCVVMGRHIGGEGRKATALSTVYGPQGTVLAAARATWIAINPTP